MMTPEGHRAGVSDKIPNRIRSMLLGGRGAVVQAGCGWDVGWVLGGGNLCAVRVWSSWVGVKMCHNSGIQVWGGGVCRGSNVQRRYPKVAEGGPFFLWR